MSMKTEVLKFKAYDKKNKRLSKPFTFGDLYGYEGEVNAVVLSHPYTSEGQEDFTIAEHFGGSLGYPLIEKEGWGMNPDLLILRWTGMVDKNGVEIYEADDVKVDEFYIGDYLQPPQICTVEFSEGEWGCFCDGEFLAELYYRVINKGVLCLGTSAEVAE